MNFSLMLYVVIADNLQIISEIKASGLRGRGGAGFPSGMKWVSNYQLRFCKRY